MDKNCWLTPWGFPMLRGIKQEMKMTGNQSGGDGQNDRERFTQPLPRRFIINSSLWRHNTIIIPGLHNTRNTWWRFNRDWQTHKFTKGSIHQHTRGCESTQLVTQNRAFSTSEISTPVGKQACYHSHATALEIFPPCLTSEVLLSLRFYIYLSKVSGELLFYHIRWKYHLLLLNKILFLRQTS